MLITMYKNNESLLKQALRLLEVFLFPFRHGVEGHAIHSQDQSKVLIGEMLLQSHKEKDKVY